MTGFKYKVVRLQPEVLDRNKSQEERAPESAEQFELLLNEMAANGWEFCRCETIRAPWIAEYTSNALDGQQDVVVFRRAA